MARKYDLCVGRDARGRVWYTRLPAGVARTGMYVRLMGDVFLIVEALESCRKLREDVPLCTAAQVLQPVWEDHGHA